MQIKKSGDSTLNIKGRNARIVVDPDKKATKNLKADVVVLTSDSDIPGSKFSPENVKFVVDSPGEYEVSGVNIFAFAVNGDRTVYLFELDGLSICHLGNLTTRLPNNVLEEMGDIDILILPLNGKEGLSIKTAVEVVNQLEARIAVPLVDSKEPLKKFAAEFGGDEEVAETDNLKFTHASLPQETEIVNLTG